MSCMDVEDILLVTTPFFESGFNGLAWTLASDPEFDQYYFDTLTIPDSRPFHEELESTVAELVRRYSNLGIVDDGSLEAKLMKTFAPAAMIIPIDELPEPTQEFIDICQSRYFLDDPEMILGLYAGYQYKRPLLFPRWQIRILNANYCRSQSRTLGQPYYIFVESEKFHRLRVAQLKLGVRMSWNILLSSPQLFRAYFFHSETKSWLNHDGHRFPHNYEAERKVFGSIIANLGIRPTNSHRVSWGLGHWSQRLVAQFPPQQAAFPLHLLLEKKFETASSYNKAERHLYGF